MREDEPSRDALHRDGLLLDPGTTAGSFLEYYPSWRSVMLAIRAAGGPYAVLGLHWDFGSRMCCVTSVFL